MKLYNNICKLFICLILFLSISIISKKNINIYNYIKENVYNNSLPFADIKNIYNKYLGGIFPINKLKTKYVFEEKLNYKEYEDYEKGVKLKVGNNYLIPAINSGIIVYIGNKEKYGNTIIIEDNNGFNIWYGNVCNNTIKLYDNIEKGNYIGESCNEYMYLVYEKDNNFYNYKTLLEN